MSFNRRVADAIELIDFLRNYLRKGLFELERGAGQLVS
jgi:hypothetical protein